MVKFSILCGFELDSDFLDDASELELLRKMFCANSHSLVEGKRICSYSNFIFSSGFGFTFKETDKVYEVNNFISIVFYKVN